MNNKQLMDLFMLDPDVQSIIDFMTYNDPNGSYSKCDLLLHPMEYSEIIDQWIEDAYLGADDPLYVKFEEFKDTLFLIYIIKNNDL